MMQHISHFHNFQNGKASKKGGHVETFIPGESVSPTKMELGFKSIHNPF